MKETMRVNEIEIPLVKARRLEALDGKIFIPEGHGPFPAVVFYHGRSSNFQGYLPIGEELARIGMVALAFNFSSDELSERDIDAEAAYSFLQGHPVVDRENLGVLGVSMGAHHAVLMAVKNKARSLLLRAPAAYPRSEKAISIRAMKDFKGDFLIVESELDEEIPHEVIELYLKNAKKAKRKELKVIRGAPHWLGKPNSQFRKEFQQIVVDWFRKTLKGGG